MNLKLISALAVSLLAAPTFATTLDFQGAGEYNFIGDYYNGGTNDAGASGNNYGISFGPDALAFSNTADFTYFSNAPTPGAMAAVGENAALNILAGFTGEVSFWYSSIADITVDIFSGLNGTGSTLGSFKLGANAQNNCSDTLYCHWDFASLNLGEVGQSIQFGSTAGFAGFDNVSVTSVPEPGSISLMLASFGALAFLRRKRSEQ